MTISGLKFPLEIVNGRFAISEEKDKLEQNMRRIASTSVVKDRWYEPNMGSIGYSGLFLNADTTTMNSMSVDIQTAINEQEPRVIASVTPSIDESVDGKIVFNVVYQRRERLDASVTGFNSFKVEL